MDYLTIEVEGKVRITEINMELKVGTSGGNTLDENKKVSCLRMKEKGSRHMSGEGPKVEKLSKVPCLEIHK